MRYRIWAMLIISTVFLVIVSSRYFSQEPKIIISVQNVDESIIKNISVSAFNNVFPIPDLAKGQKFIISINPNQYHGESSIDISYKINNKNIKHELVGYIEGGQGFVYSGKIKAYISGDNIEVKKEPTKSYSHL